MEQNGLINMVLEGTLTAVTGLATTSDTMKKTPGEKVEHQVLPRMAGKPCIRPTTTGGAIRRSLFDEIVRAEIKNNRPYPVKSLFSWLLNRQGGVASFGMTMGFGMVPEIRRKNPALSLFGAGNIPGKIAIEPAIPTNENFREIVARDQGFRSDDLRRDSGLAMDLPKHFLDEYVLLRFGAQGADNALAACRVLLDAAKVTKDPSLLADNPVTAQAYASVTGEKGETDVMDGDGDGDEDGDTKTAVKKEKKFTSIVNPYGGYEYFVPETKFSHRIVLMGLTRDEAAMAVGALYGFARRPVLGGHLKNGMGHVSMAYRVTTFDDDPLSVPQVDGDLRITSRAEKIGQDGPRPAFETTSPLIKDLLAHFLALAADGFPGMDFNAGVESEYNGLEKVKKEIEKARRAEAKNADAKSRKKGKKGADANDDGQACGDVC